ncbi:hypothetical protein [Novosphingobium sp.]|uniref:hypothetical protein n=1 Tax=Novosphingobium sp. TaxID=1874826 RepID=UPI00333E4DF3
MIPLSSQAVRAALLLVAVTGLCGSGTALAAPGGQLRVLLTGYWVCEQSGDATTPPVPRPQDSFRVVADSSYRAPTGDSGSYLLLGSDLAMTSGPFVGRRYVLIGQGILHPLDAAGQRTTDRCVRQGGAAARDRASDTAGGAGTPD